MSQATPRLHYFLFEGGGGGDRNIFVEKEREEEEEDALEEKPQWLDDHLFQIRCSD